MDFIAEIGIWKMKLDRIVSRKSKSKMDRIVSQKTDTIRFDPEKTIRYDPIMPISAYEFHSINAVICYGQKDK